MPRRSAPRMITSHGPHRTTRPNHGAEIGQRDAERHRRRRERPLVERACGLSTHDGAVVGATLVVVRLYRGRGVGGQGRNRNADRRARPPPRRCLRACPGGGCWWCWCPSSLLRSKCCGGSGSTLTRKRIGRGTVGRIGGCDGPHRRPARPIAPTERRRRATPCGCRTACSWRDVDSRRWRFRIAREHPVSDDATSSGRASIA